ncbi:MAG: pitrilysin family protein, partial [Minisyncoccia bacterium]
GGYKETVSKMTVNDLTKYKKSQYVAKNTTVVVAGNFNEAKVIDLVGKAFGSLTKSNPKPTQKTKIYRDGPRVGVKNKTTDQTHLVLGVRTFPVGDKRNDILWAMSLILSGGMSSRLFQKMREDLGICYYVSAANLSSSDHGEFNVWAGVDPLRFDEAVKEICLELGKLKTELVSVEELKRAVDATVSRMYMELETCGSVSGYYASRWMFHKDLVDPTQREKELRSITPKDIKRVANEIFEPKNFVFSVVGNSLSEKKVKKTVQQAIKNW